MGLLREPDQTQKESKQHSFYLSYNLSEFRVFALFASLAFIWEVRNLDLLMNSEKDGIVVIYCCIIHYPNT